MLHLTLEEQILHFVKTFMVVREDQILRFFDDWGAKKVNYVLEGLLQKKWLHEHKNDRISIVKTLHAPMSSYDSCIDALDVMCTMRSKDIDSFVRLDYPHELLFITSNNTVFDVTVFGLAWQAKLTQVEMMRKRELLPGIEDIVIHVAAIHEEKVAHKILPYNFQKIALLPNTPGGDVRFADTPKVSGKGPNDTNET